MAGDAGRTIGLAFLVLGEGRFLAAGTACRSTRRSTGRGSSDMPRRILTLPPEVLLAAVIATVAGTAVLLARRGWRVRGAVVAVALVLAFFARSAAKSTPLTAVPGRWVMASGMWLRSIRRPVLGEVPASQRETRPRSASRAQRGACPDDPRRAGRRAGRR